MSVIEELLFEAGPFPASEQAAAENRQASAPTALNDAIQSEARRLAALIAASADPVGAVAAFQKLLLAELSSMDKTAAAAREMRRAAGD